MPDWTRRRALSASVSGLAALAGCGGSDEKTVTGTRSRGRRVEEYEVEQVRDADGSVLFVEGDELPTGTSNRRRRYDRAYVVSADALADLAFADVPEAERLRSFAAGTNFDEASVFLFATPVDECHEVRLRSMTLDSDGDPRGDFCEALRPADVECSTDAIHTAGFAIRLPVARERASGHGAGMGGNCERPPREPAFEANVTPANGSEES